MPQRNTESLAVRFAPHLELLHGFFASRDVPFGKADDIRGFAARLATAGAFYEDMSSMLRTVVFRENMGITRTELLELLCVAVGGSQYDQAQPPVDAGVGQLLLFVNVVLLSIRKRTVEAGAEVGDDQKFAPLSPGFPPHSEGPSTHPSPLVPLELAVPEEVTVPHVVTRDSVPLSTAFSQAELPGADGPVDSYSAPKTSPLSAPPGVPDDGEHSAPSRLTRMAPDEITTVAASSAGQRVDSPPHRSSYSVPSRRRVSLSRPATIVAFAVLLLLAAVMYMYRRPSVRRQDSQPRSTPTKVPTPGIVSQGAPALTASTPQGSAAVTGLAEKNGTESPSAGAPPASAALEEPVAPRRADGEPMENLPGVASPSSSSVTDQSTALRASDPDETSHPGRGTREQPPRVHDAFSTQHSSRRGLTSVSSGVMGANLISAPAPEYPGFARLTRIEGQVILQAVISRRGTVVATHVLQGHHLLRGAAENCVRQWRYRPYLVNGRPTDVETIVFVKFQLHR